MMFNVPQFINVEDKIVGPLTAKQLGWLFLGGIIVLLLYTFLETQIFYIAAIPVLAIALAFAFYRPYGQPFVFLVGSIFYFFMRPRMYIWKKITEKNQAKNTILKTAPKKNLRKTASFDELSQISESLDINKRK